MVHILELYDKVSLNSVVSFDDNIAITVESLFRNGFYHLKAQINLRNRPIGGTNRNFVMVVLSYLPAAAWSYHAECGYSFKFKIRGTVKGIQLEIKDSKKRKVIDEYVSVTGNFKEKSFPLKRDPFLWTEIEEICFTVFCEISFIPEACGEFEIIDCMLDKELL